MKKNILLEKDGSNRDKKAPEVAPISIQNKETESKTPTQEKESSAQNDVKLNYITTDNGFTQNQVDLQKYAGLVASNPDLFAKKSTENTSNADDEYTALLNSLLTKMNTPHDSSYEELYQQMLNKYVNREPFSYDVNSDALYQQYKDQYTRNGKLAMEDTMGKANAMTGGYGNSYSQIAGQQVYQDYMSNLNDVVPELNELAYSRYQDEGENLLNKASVYSDLNTAVAEKEQSDYNTALQTYLAATGRTLDEDGNIVSAETTEAEDELETLSLKDSKALKSEALTELNGYLAEGYTANEAFAKLEKTLGLYSGYNLDDVYEYLINNMDEEKPLPFIG